MTTTTRTKPKPTPAARLADPSPVFREWWNPDGYNTATGAQTGGHQDALRRCVKIEPDGTKVVRYFGLDAGTAYNLRRYREEFDQWMRNGMLERTEVVDGTAAPLERQRAVIKEIGATLKIALV